LLLFFSFAIHRAGAGVEVTQDLLRRSWEESDYICGAASGSQIT